MKKLLYSLFALLVIVACSESGADDGGGQEKPKLPEITLDSNFANFSEDGGSCIITFTSSDDWTAEVINSRADAWCSVNPTSGVAGSSKITISTTANDSTDDRTATVKIKSGFTSKSIDVSQKHKDALTVTSSKFEVSKDGGEVSIEVKANVDFYVLIEDSARSWVKHSSTRAMKTSNVILDISKNDDSEKRIANITIWSGTISENVTIYQEGGKPSIVISRDEYNIPSAGGTIAVEVKSNVDVTVEMPTDASWVKENTTRAVSTNTYYFDIAPNKEYDERDAKIKFINKENKLSETIAISQAQKDAIVIAEDDYSISPNGDEIELEISHNIDYNITINGDWITQKQTRALETDKLTFVVAENDTDKVRTGYITFTSEDGTISQKITITQGTTAYEIRYTTSNGNILPLEFQWYHFRANVISHEYVNGVGVITFDRAIEYISTDTFANCATLTSITIPKSVTDADGSIYGCTNLENIYGPLASEDNKCLIINGELSAFAPKGLTEYTIPDDVTSIGVGIFYGCSTLKKIIIPESVTTIKDSAFWGCISLDNLDIPDGITSLPYSFCRGCKNLSSIEIPDGVTTIGSYAFFECSTLNNIVLPESVTSIEERAFYECIGLTSISIPENVTSIDDWTFYGCTNLKSVTIPEGVISIGNGAFHNCSKLTDIAIPSSVLTIGTGAFRDCDSITKIVIPNGVTKIEVDTFYNCDSLNEVTIPNSVISIGKYAFYWCDSLESITIPESVVAIEEQAFYDCGSLKEVYCKPSTPPALGNKAFFRYSYSDYPERKFYVPTSVVDAYKAKWSDYADEIVSNEKHSVNNVYLDKTSAEITVGDEIILTATITPENATNKNVRWSSSNTSVASVDNDGKVTAMNTGYTTITVTTEDGEKTATCEVTVTEKTYNVKSISLNTSEVSMMVGDEFTLEATITPENAINKTILWSCDNPAVASIENGKVKALQSGSATITATTQDGGKTASCKISVMDINSMIEVSFSGMDVSTGSVTFEDDLIKLTYGVKLGVSISNYSTHNIVLTGFKLICGKQNTATNYTLEEMDIPGNKRLGLTVPIISTIYAPIAEITFRYGAKTYTVRGQFNGSFKSKQSYLKENTVSLTPYPLL